MEKQVPLTSFERTRNDIQIASLLLISLRVIFSRRTASLRSLDREFFSRPPQRVARALLGKVLVRSTKAELLTGRIVETEAYLGEDDAAAHAAAGNTARTAVLFGPPGHAYVYFIYGNHYCLNVTCEREGKAGSVLIRALEPLQGIEQMARNRGITLGGAAELRKLTSGPGRLAQAFGITRARDNGCNLTSGKSSLWMAKDEAPAGRVCVTPRIGITKAAEQPLRFFLEGNRFVSGIRTVGYSPIPDSRSSFRTDT